MPHAFVNGFKMYYETAGDGPPLVLLHGLGSNHNDWELQIPAFAPSYRVIVPDMRGHGESDAPPGPYTIALFADDVARLLRQLQLPPAHVVGISMGGLVAQQLALDYAERVRSLVLVNTFSRIMLRGPRDWLNLLRRALVMQFFDMERIGQLVAQQLFPKPDQEVLRQLTVQRWRQNDKTAYRAAAQAALRFNVTERLGEIYCPTLIIAGQDDTTVSPPHRDVLHRGIAGSRLVVIPDSTHATPVDQPEAFNQAVLQFLHEVEGQ